MVNKLISNKKKQCNLEIEVCPVFYKLRWSGRKFTLANCYHSSEIFRSKKVYLIEKGSSKLPMFIAKNIKEFYGTQNNS